MAVKIITNEVKKRYAAKNKRRGGFSKYLKLRALGTEKYLRIENMLYSGETTRAVARLIREEWGDMTDVKEDSLHQLLRRFKRDVIQPKITHGKGFMLSDKGRALSIASSNMDLASELEKLCKLQQARIDKLLKVEEGMPLLFAGLNKELRLLKDIYRDYAILKIETGMLGRLKDGSPLDRKSVV